MASGNSRSRPGDTGESFASLLARQMNAVASPEEEFDPASESSRAIAARISAAVLENAPDAPPGDASPPQRMNVPELVDEEFRARVIAVVRAGLARSAETGTEIDRRQLECFERAVDKDTIEVQRAEEVEGLRFASRGSVLYGVDGRIGDEGPTETWDEAFVLSRMAEFRSVIIGTAGATGRGDVGHYYVTFPNPDVTLTFDQHLFHLARQQVDGV